MGEVKELNILKSNILFFDDMIDTKNFHSNLLKIDKKLHEDTGVDAAFQRSQSKVSRRLVSANAEDKEKFHLWNHSL